MNKFTLISMIAFLALPALSLNARNHASKRSRPCHSLFIYQIQKDGKICPHPIRKIDAGSSVSSLAVSRNKKLVAATNENSDELVIFKVCKGNEFEKFQTLCTGKKPVSASFSPNNKMIAVANSCSDTISVYSLCKDGKFKHTQTVCVGKRPTSVAFAQTQPVAAVVNNGSQTLTILAVNKGRVTPMRTLDVPGNAMRVDFAPDTDAGVVSGTQSGTALTATSDSITPGETISIPGGNVSLGENGSFAVSGGTTLTIGSVSPPGSFAVGTSLSLTGPAGPATQTGSVSVSDCIDTAVVLQPVTLPGGVVPAMVKSFACDAEGKLSTSTTATVAACPVTATKPVAMSQLAVAFDVSQCD